MTPNLPVPTPTDGKMWRKALRRAHPDTGGDHELFCWLSNIRERVSAEGPLGHRRRDSAPTGERINYDGSMEHHELTSRALSIAQSVEEPFRSVLRLLVDCVEVDHGRNYHPQYIGASYKQLAYAAHLASMSDSERRQWYEIAEEIPLSARHDAHLVRRLRRVAA